MTRIFMTNGRLPLVSSQQNFLTQSSYCKLINNCRYQPRTRTKPFEIILANVWTTVLNFCLGNQTIWKIYLQTLVMLCLAIMEWLGGSNKPHFITSRCRNNEESKRSYLPNKCNTKYQMKWFHFQP